MALSCLAAAALFAPTVGTLVAAWSESRTYAHGFLVIPGTLYLVWCYRDRIALPAPRPWGWIAAAVPSGMWLTGRIQHNVTLEQVSVLATIPCLVYCVWGEAVFRQLLLPLGFLVFALPVGASLEPWLQEITTDFLAFSLQAADIPFHREGYFITLPSGQWEVAVDCGGLRYLLPGMALGYLYAAVVYRRPLPRILFLSLCAVLLTLANGLRAYAILVADYLGFADGTDHRVFSYLVYGVTIIVLAWVGHRWSPPAHAVSEPDAIGSRPLVRAAVMNAVAATGLLALAPLIVWMMAAGKEVVTQGTAELDHSVSDVARP
ncbi:MAG TPA: exosortase A [Nitrospiraceae bacterium]|nr:exosortase A [Nitrospiraceae bacterium]